MVKMITVKNICFNISTFNLRKHTFKHEKSVNSMRVRVRVNPKPKYFVFLKEKKKKTMRALSFHLPMIFKNCRRCNFLFHRGERLQVTGLSECCGTKTRLVLNL